MDSFPYSFRRNQKEIICTIRNVLQDKRSFVFESGTGSGKTICALYACLEYALQHKKKIVYATRTNAQQRQVILELREIQKNMPEEQKADIFGIGLQGRAHMCMFAKNNDEYSKGTAEELSKMCTYQKKQVTQGKKNKGCPYYRKFLMEKETVDNVVSWSKQTIPTVEEFIRYCNDHQLCAYEINKVLISEAVLIVVPYVYIFSPGIRIKLFDWLSVSESDLILIVDEAHNLPDYLRDLFSNQLSLWMLQNCSAEAEKHGDPSMAEGKITVSKLCTTITDILFDMRDTYVYGVMENGMRTSTGDSADAFIPSHELETELMARLHIPSKILYEIISDLTAYGEKIQEYQQKEGKLPRSYLHRLGGFLQFWMNTEMEQYIKLIVDDKQGKNPRVEAYCLDPAIGGKLFQEVHSSIHMSGTLEPLEEYRDSLGLAHSTELVRYPSPFPKKNRLVLYSRDVTTKYDDLARDKTMIQKMEQYIREICNQFPKNTMVFFPSFNMMNLFRHRGICTSIQRCVFIEEQGMTQTELMGLVEDFKDSGNTENDKAALFSVMGGRISEGMDFPAEELEIAIIVGIPYPKPTARQRGLQQYYEMKFGKGWEYTVHAPTARKMLQSIGRLIRNEQDRGVAIILDKRAARFQQVINDLQLSQNLLSDVNVFLQKKE